MDQFDAIIIGAGPAGMMATIRAAERKRKVLSLSETIPDRCKKYNQGF